VSHSKKVKKEKKRCQCWTVLDLLRLGAIQNELGAWDLISIVLNDPLEAHTTSVDFLLRTNAAIRFVTFFFPPPPARHPYVWEGSAGEQEQQQVGLAVWPPFSFLHSAPVPSHYGLSPRAAAEYAARGGRAGELAACPLTASTASTCGCFTACLCPILLQLALADPGLAPTGLQGFFIQRETFIVQKSALFSSQTSECVRGWMP
jgi:hypothetical protein